MGLLVSSAQLKFPSDQTVLILKESGSELSVINVPLQNKSPGQVKFTPGHPGLSVGRIYCSAFNPHFD